MDSPNLAQVFSTYFTATVLCDQVETVVKKVVLSASG